MSLAISVQESEKLKAEELRSEAKQQAFTEEAQDICRNSWRTGAVSGASLCTFGVDLPMSASPGDDLSEAKRGAGQMLLALQLSLT